MPTSGAPWSRFNTYSLLFSQEASSMDLVVTRAGILSSCLMQRVCMCVTSHIGRPHGRIRVTWELVHMRNLLCSLGLHSSCVSVQFSETVRGTFVCWSCVWRLCQ
jgi:hypothetical protein